MKLINEQGIEVKVGDTVTSFRGEKNVVTGWRKPHHAGSTGCVFVKIGTCDSEYFPSVYGLKWSNEDDS